MINNGGLELPACSIDCFRLNYGHWFGVELQTLTIKIYIASP